MTVLAPAPRKKLSPNLRRRSKKVLVLGSEGLIGTHLCERLRDGGHRVIGLDIKRGTDLRLLEPSTASYFDWGDFVFFLAFDVGGWKYMSKVQNGFRFLQNNVQIMHNVFGWLSQSKKPFAFASSQMQNLLESPYGNLKRIGEDYTLSLGGISVRLWNVYGFTGFDPERSTVIPDLALQALTGPEIRLLSRGDEERQFLHARDCSKALEVIMERFEDFRDRRTIDVSSGNWTTILHVASILSRIAGKPVTKGVETSLVHRTKNEPDSFLHRFWTPAISLEEGIGEVYRDMGMRLEMEELLSSIPEADGLQGGSPLH